MARQISEEVAAGVKELITQISGFEEGTDKFLYIQRYVLTTLKKSDTMYFLNKREMDENISGMAEKFIFHGFFPQAKALEDSYKAYVTETLTKSELTSRLNILKFLLCMSERPTSKFLENPEGFQTEPKEEEEDINWAEYLNEGIEPWNPNFDETSPSDTSCSEDETEVGGNPSGYQSSRVITIIDESEKGTVVDLKTNREELLATIQHTWYNRESFYMPPFSDWREANIGILWDKFLEDQVRGLIPIKKSSILSEYKVIREILWQLRCLHNSAVFEIEGDRIKPRSDVTISSIRAVTFENFIKEFIPYMGVLDFFRAFSKSLEVRTDASLTEVAQTLRSYNNSLQNIIRPVYKQLSEVEETVRKQEVTYTILKLANELQEIFEPIMILKKIHDEVVLDFKENTRMRCATFLISSLHYGLQFSLTKLEQDLRLTLFLGTLYHYLTLVDSWLTKNHLSDYSEEFVIVNKNKPLYSSTFVNEDSDESTSEAENWKLNFDLRCEVDEFCANDGIIKIMRETVLQIGRNIHLLRQLGMLSSLNDCTETMHKEFVRKSLEKLNRFFKCNSEKSCEEEIHTDDAVEESISEKKYKYPVVCTEDCIRPTEFDKLENLVDTSDGFLMLAFEDYLLEKNEPKTKPQEETLFERVSKTTRTMFPTCNFFEDILNDMLKERFMISGLMVKNILIEKYLLEKQFQFLRHVFLFYDDMIFPFYRRLFELTNVQGHNWGNDIWLTSYLQDAVMDVYPEFYEGCRVQVGEGRRHCTDSLNACKMIGVQYDIKWPLDLIITAPQMGLYKDMFGFVMQIKWALYTVNHLSFTDLEPKKVDKTQLRTRRNAIMKLKYLKFSLTNALNSIQHYIFSFVFTRCLQKFELDFEKANDLSLIIASHAKFINAIYSMTMDIRQSGGSFPAFENIIDCVKLLQVMWKSIETATPNRLLDCYNIYKKCYNAIEPIICPMYIFDY